MENLEKLSIFELCDGAALVAADDEVQKALTNIMDPNTEATALRKVNLEIKFKPNKERNMCEVLIQATSKLAPDAPLETTVLTDQHRGKGVARELKTSRDYEEAANVTNIKEAASK